MHPLPATVRSRRDEGPRWGHRRLTPRPFPYAHPLARIPFYRIPILRAVALGYAARVLDRASPPAAASTHAPALRQLLDALQACPQPELLQRDWAVLVEAEPGLAAL